jgi:hypothetical protein
MHGYAALLRVLVQQLACRIPEDEGDQGPSTIRAIESLSAQIVERMGTPGSGTASLSGPPDTCKIFRHLKRRRTYRRPLLTPS